MKKKFRVCSELLDIDTARNNICKECGAAQEMVDDNRFRGTTAEYATIYAPIELERNPSYTKDCSKAILEGRCGLAGMARKMHGDL